MVAVADSASSSTEASRTSTIEFEKPNVDGDDVEDQPKNVAGRCSSFDRSPKASGPRGPGGSLQDMRRAVASEEGITALRAHH